MPRISSKTIETKKATAEFLNEVKRDRLNHVLLCIKIVLPFRDSEREDNSNFARDYKSLCKFYYNLTRDPSGEEMDKFLDNNPCSKNFDDVMDWCDKRIVRHHLIMALMICHGREINMECVSTVRGGKKFGDNENAVRALDIDIRDEVSLSVEMLKSIDHFDSKDDRDFVNSFYGHVIDLPSREKELERINNYFYEKVSDDGYGAVDDLKDKSSSIFKHIYVNSNKFEDLRTMSENDDLIEYAKNLIRKVRVSAYRKNGQECFVERIKCVLKDIGDRRANDPMVIEKVNRVKNYERYAEKSVWHGEIVNKLEEAYRKTVESANQKITVCKMMITAVGYLEKIENFLNECLKKDEYDGAYFLQGFSKKFYYLESQPENILRFFLEKCSACDLRKLITKVYVEKISVKNERVKNKDSPHSAENFVLTIIRMFKYRDVFGINCADKIEEINITELMNKIPDFRAINIDDGQDTVNHTINDEDTQKIIAMAEGENKHKIVFAIRMTKEFCLRPQELVSMTVNDVVIYTNRGEIRDVIEYENGCSRGYRGTLQSQLMIDDYSTKDYCVTSKITILVKNENLRDIFVDKNMRKIISDYLKLVYGDETPNPTDYLFPQRNKNKPISGMQLCREFRLLRKKCGITENFSIYNYKHTKVTECINSGMTLCDVAKIVGNIDEETVQKYYFVDTIDVSKKSRKIYKTTGTQYEATMTEQFTQT